MSLTWTQTSADVWRSTDGRYVILLGVLPEDRPNPTEIYMLRKIDPDSARAYPGTMGYFVAERYQLPEAKQEAETDAWREAQGTARHVPEDFPGLALRRFWWPISGGTEQGALVIVREDGRILARVVGMCRGDEDRYEPGTYAEVDITDIAAELTTRH